MKLLQNQLDKIRFQAHNLKGAAGVLGLTTLEQASRELEKNNFTNDSSQAEHLLQNIKNEQIRLSSVLAPLFEKSKLIVKSITPKSGSDDQILTLLQQKLSEDDVTVNQYVVEHKSFLLDLLGAELAQLEQAIEIFDYPTALTLIKKMVI